MRTRITLSCTECKQRNYNTTKDKKAHPERIETKKYCRFCSEETLGHSSEGVYTVTLRGDHDVFSLEKFFHFYFLFPFCHIICKHTG